MAQERQEQRRQSGTDSILVLVIDAAILAALAIVAFLWAPEELPRLYPEHSTVLRAYVLGIQFFAATYIVAHVLDLVVPELVLPKNVFARLDWFTRYEPLYTSLIGCVLPCWASASIAYLVGYLSLPTYLAVLAWGWALMAMAISLRLYLAVTVPVWIGIAALCFYLTSASPPSGSPGVYPWSQLLLLIFVTLGISIVIEWLSVVFLGGGTEYSEEGVAVPLLVGLFLGIFGASPFVPLSASLAAWICMAHRDFVAPPILAALGYLEKGEKLVPGGAGASDALWSAPAMAILVEVAYLRYAPQREWVQYALSTLDTRSIPSVAAGAPHLDAAGLATVFACLLPIAAAIVAVLLAARRH